MSTISMKKRTVVPAAVHFVTSTYQTEVEKESEAVSEKEED